MIWCSKVRGAVRVGEGGGEKEMGTMMMIDIDGCGIDDGDDDGGGWSIHVVSGSR